MKIKKYMLLLITIIFVCLCILLGIFNHKKSFYIQETQNAIDESFLLMLTDLNLDLDYSDGKEEQTYYMYGKVAGTCESAISLFPKTSYQDYEELETGLSYLANIYNQLSQKEKNLRISDLETISNCYGEMLNNFHGANSDKEDLGKGIEKFYQAVGNVYSAFQ